MLRKLTILTTFLVTCLVALTGLTATAEAQRPIPVNIESTPPGATVHLDSPDSPSIGTTPLSRVRVPRGNHTLIFKLANHEEGRLPVNVRRYRETFQITLNALGSINVSAGNASATGAEVRIDGQPVGTIPVQHTVQPGRHLIQVGREGFVTFTQWAEIGGGQVMALPVMLERSTPETGSILVAGDISGAPVYLDGDPRGVTPTLIENVTAGSHRLEIRADGMPPHTETIRIIAGERLSVNPTIRPRPAPGGSLRVISNVPGAEISLDGELLGTAPATRESVPPGEHILEASADGYANVQQPVTIEAGQQRVVSLRLTPSGGGRIVVSTDARNATVTVDGEDRGRAPVALDGVAAGTHTIIVSAPGHEDFRHTCETGPGVSCTVNADLEIVGTPVTVASNAPGTLYVDGTRVGPVPFEGNLPVGEHTLEVRAEGYATFTRQVSLEASETPRAFDVALVQEGVMTEEDRAAAAAANQARLYGQSSHQAAPLVQGSSLLDVSLGYPFIAEFRLGVGLLDEFIDAGFGFRTTTFRYNEFELRGKVGYRPLALLSLAGQVRVGGGFGPSRDGTAVENEAAINAMAEAPTHATNSFFLSLEGLATLHFSQAGSFTLIGAFDFHTDEYDWTGADSDVLLVSDYPGARPPSPTSGNLRTGRQTGARFRLGGALELALSRSLNVFVMMEGVIGPDRDILGDIFGFELADPNLYFRLGITSKF